MDRYGNDEDEPMNVSQGAPREPVMDRAQVEQSLAALQARGLVGSGERAAPQQVDVFSRDIAATLGDFLPPRSDAPRPSTTAVHPSEVTARLAGGGAAATFAALVGAADAKLRELTNTKRSHVTASLEDGWLKIHAPVFQAHDRDRLLTVDHRGRVDSPMHVQLRDAVNDVTALATAIADAEALRGQLPKPSVDADKALRTLRDLRVRVTADTNGGTAPDVLLDAFVRDVRTA